MFEYVGNIHIHSNYSDGSKNIKQIAGEASRVGLDFIIITDHNQLTGLYKGQEKYYKDVLVLIGSEVNCEKNHYLALDIEKDVPPDDDQPQNVINEVNKQGGLGIIAHPDEEGSRYVHNGRTYPWDDWSVDNFQGLEIWNFLSQWRDSIKSLPKGIAVLLCPHSALSGPNPNTLSRFDQYHQEGRKIVAFGGSDAHGIELKAGSKKLISVSDYGYCFRCVNMHILTSERLTFNVANDRQIVFRALASGCTWISDDYYHSSRGFTFKITGDRPAGIGEDVHQSDNTIAILRTPIASRVKLIKDGELYKFSEGKEHNFENLDKGVYRAECYIRRYCRYKPWIFTNCIKVV